jgi:hypothetical protein
VDLAVGHLRQPGEDVAKVGLWIESTATAAFGDREENCAAFTGIGMAEERQFFFLWGALHNKNYVEVQIMPSSIGRATR